MAKDTDTFDTLFNMLAAYMAQGGGFSSAFLDGSYKTELAVWGCVNTRGACPTTMPWQPGEPNGPLSNKCVAIGWGHVKGVVDTYCDLKRMVMCQFTM